MTMSVMVTKAKATTRTVTRGNGPKTAVEEFIDLFTCGEADRSSRGKFSDF